MIKSIQIIITSLNNRETNERQTKWRRITKNSNQSIYKIKTQCIKIMFFTILAISIYNFDTFVSMIFTISWTYIPFISYPEGQGRKIEKHTFKLAMHKNIKSTIYRFYKPIFFKRMPQTWCHKLSFYGYFFIFYKQGFAVIFLVQRFLMKRIFEEIQSLLTITFFSLFTFPNLLFINEDFPSHVDALCQVCLILVVYFYRPNESLDWWTERERPTFAWSDKFKEP